MARKRRGRGEGGIRQRKSDGLWLATVSHGYDGDGKRVRRTVYGKTKREAQEKLDALRADVRVGALPEADVMTVGQLLDQWLKASEAKTGARTHEERERLVRKHLWPRLGGVRLAKLNALQVEGLYADMRRDGVKPFALRDAAVALNVALNHAVRLRLLPTNPAAAVPKPRVPKRDMLFLTDDQARRLRQAAAGGAAVGPLVAAALGSGCRQGELLALEWGDLDLRAATLTVRRSLSRTRAGFVVKEPKTAASRRTVKLPAFAVAALTAHKADAMKRGLLSAPVFCTRTGGHLDKKNVLRAFRGVVRRANQALAPAAEDGPRPIPEGVRFHDLRHTVASLLLSAGHSLRAVSQRLGHANPTMTLRVYAHCMPTDDARLAAGLDALLA